MVLDPKTHMDWEIAEEAEKNMQTIYQIGEKMGLTKEELLPHGHYIGKIDYAFSPSGSDTRCKRRFKIMRYDVRIRYNSYFV